MKKIALILSGCGYRDGSEITEAVSLLVSLSSLGAQIHCFAPTEKNILAESARIARGQIEEIKKLNPDDFDAVVFPGGFGAALNLCDWASKGAGCEVHAEIRRVIEGFYEQSKPVGAVCIAPVLIAKVLGSRGVELTIGNDSATIQEIKKTGAQHVECPVDDYVTDRANKVITTPAYMYEAKPHEVFKGISGLAKELVEMA